MANFNGIFKSLVVSGETKELALANGPFKSYLKDATQAYKNWREKQNVVTPEAEKEFMVEYTKKYSKGAPGIGFSITLTPAVASTRERPYKITDVKNEQGKRKYVTNYVIKDMETGEVLATCDETKAKAKEIAKELYKKGLKHKITCTYQKLVAEGEPVAFKGEYVPSKGSHNGTYMVFGVIDD